MTLTKPIQKRGIKWLLGFGFWDVDRAVLRGFSFIFRARRPDWTMSWR